MGNTPFFVAVELLESFLLDRQGRKRNLDGGNVVEADTLDGHLVRDIKIHYKSKQPQRKYPDDLVIKAVL